jgi:hypothetical protein
MIKSAAVLFAGVLCLPGTLWAADVVTVPSMSADFTAEQRTKLEQALVVANRVLGSTAFRDQLSAIERFNYSGDDGSAVYAALLAKSYTLEFDAVAKYAIRVRVFGRTITRKSKMIARTGEGSGKITFNTARMADFDVGYYAGTIVHELTHIAGYHHWGNSPTRANQRSVPYRVGVLVRQLAAEAGLDPVPSAGPSTATPGTAGGLSGALGDSGSSDATPSSGSAGAGAADSGSAGAQPRRRATFAARVRRTLARLFRRR